MVAVSLKKKNMVNAETWLTANEAVTLGLADEVGDGLKVKACLGQGSVLHRFQNAPAELLAQLDEEPDVEPTDPVNPADPAPVLDAAGLALMVTKGCAAAGISNLVDPILASTKLESEAVVTAALTKAKALHGLCVAARLPELTGEFLAAGLDEAAVRARLFDKLVSSGGGFEINNSLPLDNDPAPTIKAKQVDSHSIWASRQAAQNGTSKGVRA